MEGMVKHMVQMLVQMNQTYKKKLSEPRLLKDGEKHAVNFATVYLLSKYKIN